MKLVSLTVYGLIISSLLLTVYWANKDVKAAVDTNVLAWMKEREFDRLKELERASLLEIKVSDDVLRASL